MIVVPQVKDEENSAWGFLTVNKDLPESTWLSRHLQAVLKYLCSKHNCAEFMAYNSCPSKGVTLALSPQLTPGAICSLKYQLY